MVLRKCSIAFFSFFSLRFFRVAAVLGSLLLAVACSEDFPTTTTNGNGNQDPGIAPDFLLADMNPLRSTFGHAVSPRDYLQSVSSWYFISATCDECRSQLGFINDLQAEIDTLGWALDFQFLGVNLVGSLSGILAQVY